MIHRILTASIVALFLCTALVLPQDSALAASFTVSSAAQLVAAIKAANQTAAPDTIILTANITLTTALKLCTSDPQAALPPVITPITIEGQGFAITRSASSPMFRIGCVHAGGDLTLNNLTVSGG